MSEEEIQETMEERYEDIGTVLTAYLEDAQSASTKACLVWGSDLADIGKLLVDLWTERTKYPLAPVSSTLDQLLFTLDLKSPGAAEAERKLGEIEHKGEKVMVKIKVVRGE